MQVDLHTLREIALPSGLGLAVFTLMRRMAHIVAVRVWVARLAESQTE